jgi:hypothetical protein
MRQKLPECFSRLSGPDFLSFQRVPVHLHEKIFYHVYIHMYMYIH